MRMKPQLAESIENRCRTMGKAYQTEFNDEKKIGNHPDDVRRGGGGGDRYQTEWPAIVMNLEIVEKVDMFL